MRGVSDSCLRPARWTGEANNFAEKNKISLKMSKIITNFCCDWFYLEKSKGLTSTSATSRVNPVAAVSGDNPFESDLAAAPSKRN